MKKRLPNDSYSNRFYFIELPKFLEILKQNLSTVKTVGDDIEEFLNFYEYDSAASFFDWGLIQGDEMYTAVYLRETYNTIYLRGL